jgi:hypothetical protein
MPGASSTDIIATCLTDILAALETPSPNAPINPLQPTQIETLKQLIDIFKTTAPKEADPAQLPRVSTEEPAPLPRVPDKRHRYPTRAPAPLPPARDSAYTVSRPSVPLPPEVETENQQHHLATNEEQMEAAIIRSLLQDALEDATQGPLQFANIAHRLASDEPTAPSWALSALACECENIPTLDPDASMHIPKGYALKALNVDTETLEEYKNLRLSSEGLMWIKSCSEEFHRLCSGTPNQPGTNTMFFIPHTQVPTGRKVTYMRLVVTDQPQKANPRRVRITVGGDKLDYPFDISTRTAGLTTAKILFNSVVSTKNAKFCTMDIKDFYLNTPMDRYEYMRIPIDIIPEDIFEYYNLKDLVHNGSVTVEICKGMYGLSSSRRLASDDLKPHLQKWGYH